MMKNTTKTAAVAAGTMLFDDWFDPIEDAVRETVRSVIETIMEEELDATLSRPRYGRWKAAGSIDDAAPIVGSRHGHRTRTLTGTFGKTEIAVPRARIKGEDGKVTEWKSKALRAYQRRTKQAEALIAGAYLSGTNTRRVRRALSAVFKGAVGKDVVSRTWRKVKGDWDAWNARSLKDEPIVRLILDGTVVRVHQRAQRAAFGVCNAAPSLAFFIVDISKTLIRGRAFQRAPLLSGLPKHDFLDFFCQFEILVGDSLGGMILEPDFDPSIRGGKIGVMPSRLGKMADRVDHHQRALPARCLVGAANPAPFIDPSRQFLLEASFYLEFAIGLFLGGFAHREHPFCWLGFRSFAWIGILIRNAAVADSYTSGNNTPETRLPG